MATFTVGEKEAVVNIYFILVKCNVRYNNHFRETNAV